METADEIKKRQFKEMGGRPILQVINTLFYDKVYAHPWLGLYFKDVPQKIIEEQQVDFMTATLGGGMVYLGKLPVPAHKHMFITEELFDIRQDLLKQAFVEAKAPPILVEKLLKVDEAFRDRLTKSSLSECEKRFHTDELVFFRKPDKIAA